MHNTLAQWILRVSSLEYLTGTELLRMHQELHEDYGEKPSEAIYDCEQKLSAELSARGFEHRHFDALSKEAGTLVEQPAVPSLYEVASYLQRQIRLQDGAVSIAKGLEDAEVYLKIEGAGLQGLEQAILRMMTRWLPPGIVLKLLSEAKGEVGGFVEFQPTHDLLLDWNYCCGRSITTWEALGINIRIVAAKSAPGIFSEKKDPMIPFRVVKAEPGGTLFPADSVYVFGPTLIPNRLDTTKTFPDGTPTGAVGDIVDGKAVRGAFEFWTAAKRAFEIQHEFAAGPQGRRLGEDEVVMLDNFTSPAELTMQNRSGEPETFPADTWFQGARILNAQVAKDALDRKLNAWSIYANCLGKLEDAPS